MSRLSAGILLYREAAREREVLIAYPGGPFFSNKRTGAWTIPKGLVDDEETPEAAAQREWEEETGLVLPDGDWIDLGETQLRSGKRVRAWALEGDVDPLELSSNTFDLEWPRGSGRLISVPEVDEMRWVGHATAATLLNPAQVVFVERLFKILAAETDE